MKYSTFESFISCKDFDPMVCLDSSVLHKSAQKFAGAKDVSLEVQTLQHLKRKLTRERGLSKKTPQSLPLFERICNKFVDVYTKEYLSVFGTKPSLDHVEFACRQIFSAISSEKYLNVVLARHRMRDYFQSWGFLETAIDISMGRASFEEAVPKTKALECVQSCVEKYLINNGFKSAPEVKVGFDAIKDLMLKLENGAFVPVESHIELCVSFIEHLKTEGISRIDLIPHDKIHSLAAVWCKSNSVQKS